MAAPRNRKHILVPGPPTAEEYKPHGRKIDIPKPPAPASRPAHGKALKQALESAVAEAHQRRTDAGFQVHGAVPGLHFAGEHTSMEFQGFMEGAVASGYRAAREVLEAKRPSSK